MGNLLLCLIYILLRIQFSCFVRSHKLCEKKPFPNHTKSHGSSRLSKNSQNDWFGSSIWQILTRQGFSCHLTSFWPILDKLSDKFWYPPKRSKKAYKCIELLFLTRLKKIFPQNPIKWTTFWQTFDNFLTTWFSGSSKACLFRHQRGDGFGSSKICRLDNFLTSFWGLRF